MKGLPEKRIIQTFKDHDIEDVGTLNAENLHKALLSLQVPIKLSDMNDLFESVGRDKEMCVDERDFLDIVSELKGIDDEYDDEASLTEEEDFVADVAFKMLVDPAINGITLESLLKACEKQDESWTRQQLVEMMNEADLNHDGIIDNKEFRLVCEKAGL